MVIKLFINDMYPFLLYSIVSVELKPRTKFNELQKERLRISDNSFK